MQRGAVLALEGIALTQPLRTGKDVGGDDLVEEPRELGVHESDAVERFEFLAEVALERFAVADVVAVGVPQTLELFNEYLFDLLFFGLGHHPPSSAQI